MSHTLVQDITAQLAQIKADGLYKSERRITSPQSTKITVNGHEVVNFCANNYLGLANHSALVDAAKSALDSHGFGMASVRFICGTQDLHQQLEQRLAAFLRMEDCILFPSCFDANGGIFEPLLSAEDAIISDSLNHASIIDGVRLCKAQRYRYKNNDMADLETQLIAAQSARHRLIVTDGVFSMDGIIADLAGICALAEKYDALVMVDDCHATGFMGARGAGTPEFTDTEGRVQILTGTLGKALGGASGGYVAGPKPLIDMLRQKARPYLFSNAVAPAICAASLSALDLIEAAADQRETLKANAKRFRDGMTAAGFTLPAGQHPIMPVMLKDAEIAAKMADDLLSEGIYVIAFSFPVVPKGAPRIRVQMSAAHTNTQIDDAIAAFTKVAQKYEVI